MESKLTQKQLIQFLKDVLPDSQNLTGVSVVNSDTVEFYWRRVKFYVTTSLKVGEDFGLHGHGLLMQALLDEAYAHRPQEAVKKSKQTK